MYKSLLVAIPLLLMICMSVYADSQTLPPTPIRIRQPQHETTPTAQQPDSDKRHTKGSSLFIDVMQAKDEKEKAEREEKYENEKATTARLLANYTLALASITAILAIFTGGLWYVTYRLSNAAKKTGDRQADEM